MYRKGFSGIIGLISRLIHVKYEIRMKNSRLEKQIKFILEIDKLKSVFRRSYVLGTNRKENDSEHSWHIAMMAIVLSEYSDSNINILKVLRMVLIHDIVEIDAGDTFCYDEKGAVDKLEREISAANRIFGLLPNDQKKEYIELWEEFEEGRTSEAMFAKSLDRLMPLLHNYYSEGKAWKENDIRQEQVFYKNKHIADGSKGLWELVHSIIEKAVDRGYLLK
jgi:putative hydrolase of HD superfamily